MRLLRTATLFVATGLVLLGLSRSASADLTVYAATAQGDFGTLNLETGQYTSVGPTGANASIVGMGFSGGVLYGVDMDSNGAGFYSINTATGAATSIATLAVTAYGGTTYAANFYGVTQDVPTGFFSSDTAGNAAVINTNPNFEAGGLVALSSDTNYMYLSSAPDFQGSSELYTLAKAGGALTDIGALGTSSITGIIFGNTLYSIDGDNIYTYDLTGGVSGPLSTTAILGLEATGDQVFSVAAVPIPEPSTMVIAGVAIAAGGLFQVRRRRAA